jgi:hypothetical protein
MHTWVMEAGSAMLEARCWVRDAGCTMLEVVPRGCLWQKLEVAVGSWMHDAGCEIPPSKHEIPLKILCRKRKVGGRKKAGGGTYDSRLTTYDCYEANFTFSFLYLHFDIALGWKLDA